MLIEVLVAIVSTALNRGRLEAIRTAPKPADKPGSVSPAEPGRRSSLWDDGYPSPLAAYPGLERDGPPRVRATTRVALALPLLGLAPGGGCLAARVAAGAGGLLHHLFTLTSVRWDEGGLLFCGPFPSGRPAWMLSSTVPCGARTFLTPFSGRDRLAGLGANLMITRYGQVSRESPTRSLLSPEPVDRHHGL